MAADSAWPRPRSPGRNAGGRRTGGGRRRRCRLRRAAASRQRCIRVRRALRHTAAHGRRPVRLRCGRSVRSCSRCAARRTMRRRQRRFAGPPAGIRGESKRRGPLGALRLTRHIDTRLLARLPIAIGVVDALGRGALAAQRINRGPLGERCRRPCDQRYRCKPGNLHQLSTPPRSRRRRGTTRRGRPRPDALPGCLRGAVPAAQLSA